MGLKPDGAGVYQLDKLVFRGIAPMLIAFRAIDGSQPGGDRTPIRGHDDGVAIKDALHLHHLNAFLAPMLDETGSQQEHNRPKSDQNGEIPYDDGIDHGRVAFFCSPGRRWCCRVPPVQPSRQPRIKLSAGAKGP